MLLNSYFEITNKVATDDVFRYSVRLNPNHEVYKGHFPGMPVCPGVCSTQMIRECIQEATGVKLLISELKQVKFSSLITPNENPNLDIIFSLSDEGDSYKTKCTIESGDTTFLTLKGELKKMQ